MLKSFDILIGFAVVMLIASMAVTVLTQIWTALANTRGTHLRDGLINLLNQLHCTISPAHAQAIASHILTHPLVRDGKCRLGTLIHRDELTRLLLDAASPAGRHRLPELCRQALRDALAHNGITEPEAVLHRIRHMALTLEASSPALGNAARHDLAILQAASGEFVAKINGWFDQTIERVSARFTLTTRRITLVNSVLVAVLIQMDSVSLVNRLASNDSLRSSLVEKAYAQDKLSAMDPHQLTALASNNIFPVPANPKDWLSHWHLANLPGTVLSVLLLSLGAPFWFEMLKDMLKLRRVIQKT